MLGFVAAETARAQLQLLDVCKNGGGQAGVIETTPRDKLALGGAQKRAGAAAGGKKVQAAAGGAAHKAAGARSSLPAPPAAASSVDAEAASKAAAAAGAEAVRCFARAAVVAARAGPEGAAWHAALNAARVIWNSGRPLINALPPLSAASAEEADQLAAAVNSAAQPTAWQLQPLPTLRCPPLGLAACQPAGAAEGSPSPPKPGKAGAAGKALGRTASNAAGPGAGGKGGAAAAAPPARLVPQPAPRRPAECTAAAAAAAAEALLSIVQRIRSGAAYHPGARPLGAAAAPATSAGDRQLQRDQRERTGADAAEADEKPAGSFSFGSDALTVAWYTWGPVDVPFVGGVVQALMSVLRGAECWHAVMSIGECWKTVRVG